MSVTENTLPPEQQGPAAWIGNEMAADPSQWLSEWSEAEVAELEAAAEAFRSTGRDIGEIDTTQFPLPTIAPRLARLREKLTHGNGVELITGLPVDRLDRWTAAAIFCGVGSHIGSARSQNAAGHILGHVRDVGADASAAYTRIYQTAARQTFHTDSADVVGLLCLRPAKEGGRSLLVSAETIYNRMRAARPDLVARLFDPIASVRRGEVPEGMKPFMEIPPLSWQAGKLTFFYQRQYIDSAQRFPEALRLSEDHILALDMFDALANDPELNFAMDLVPGDMQFVYNHAQLHDRTGFTDWPYPDKRRHLLRLWLSVPGDRALPDCFRERYGSIEIGNRGGIITSGTRLHAPLD